MTTEETDPESGPLAALQTRLGYRFTDPGLLQLALTHRTFVEEAHPGLNKPSHLSQQRLEFLGDAILSYAISAWLYAALPLAEEGELTERRKQYAGAAWLGERSRQLDIPAAMRLGNGARLTLEQNHRLAEDALEAVIGAIALDGGEAAAIRLIRAWLPETPAPLPAGDPVPLFNEWYQKTHKVPPPPPAWEGVGADNEKVWTATFDDGVLSGRASGRTKPEAKRAMFAQLLAQIAAL